MKITILDGNAVNPGDLSWAPLEAFGTVRVFARTAPEEAAAHIADSDAILLNKVPITGAVLDECPALRYIGIQATGYNVVDLAACRRHGVTVTNVPSYSTSGVAQLTFAFISEFASRVRIHADSVAAGDWTRSPDFCYWKAAPMELEGKVIGILGYGAIGRRVAAIARAYGMNVIVHTRTPRADCGTLVDFATLLAESDVLTLHAPLTPETSGIIHAAALARMKPTSYLVNTARGGLVVEQDVRAALMDGTIAGYAADVSAEEPMRPDSPLLGIPRDRIILTPHIAWAARETRSRLLGEVVENLRAYLAGAPRNVVSQATGPFGN